MSEVMLQHSKPAAQNFQEQRNLFLPKKHVLDKYGNNYTDPSLSKF